LERHGGGIQPFLCDKRRLTNATILTERWSRNTTIRSLFFRMKGFTTSIYGSGNRKKLYQPRQTGISVSIRALSVGLKFD
jgi:hypothetical protein